MESITLPSLTAIAAGIAPSTRPTTMVVTQMALFPDSAKTSRPGVDVSEKRPVSAFSVHPPAFSAAITFVRMSLNDPMP